MHLSLRQPQPGDLISLLHFPRGTTVLSSSFGYLASAGDRVLYYQIDSEHGSGGGPLFDAEWRLIGIHLLSDEKDNCQALNRAALLELLQKSASWKEIAEAHKLADAAEGRKRLAEVSVPKPDSVNEYSIRAALLESFSRPDFPTRTASFSATRWSRSRANGGCFRPACGRAPAGWRGRWRSCARGVGRNGAASRVGQQVIDRILDGQPYDLSQESEEALTWWIRATRWFSGVEPALPQPADVTKMLERRRVRSRLDAIAAPRSVAARRSSQPCGPGSGTNRVFRCGSTASAVSANPPWWPGSLPSCPPTPCF